MQTETSIKIKRIEGNIEGVPFILIQKKDLEKWSGFYIEDENSSSPDLTINGRKYVCEDDPKKGDTDWGFVLACLDATTTPLILRRKGIDFAVIEPSYFTAWEGFSLTVVETYGKIYFVMYVESEFDVSEEFFQRIESDAENWNEAVEWGISDTEVTLLPSTEHGLDSNVTPSTFFKVAPGSYLLRFYLPKVDNPKFVVYKLDALT